MMAIKQWFNNLPKREQYLLIIGGVVVLLYLLYLFGYKNIADQRDRYRSMNNAAEETLTWMNSAVAEIATLRRSGNVPADSGNRSLAQLSELAAGRAGIRVNRFAPSGDNEAQVWFERIEFEKLLDCLSALELDYGVRIDNIAINAVNSPGLVNARLKITR